MTPYDENALANLVSVTCTMFRMAHFFFSGEEHIVQWRISEQIKEIFIPHDMSTLLCILLLSLYKGIALVNFSAKHPKCGKWHFYLRNV